MHLTEQSILEITLLGLTAFAGFLWMAARDFRSLRKRPDRPEHDHFG